jgi:hypothetical protein
VGVGSYRYRKQIKLATGVKLNINAQSMSVSLGGRKARLTYNTKGQVTTSLAIPVTGLSYRHTQAISPSTTSALQSLPGSGLESTIPDCRWTKKVRDTTVAITHSAAYASYDVWVYDSVRAVWEQAGRYGRSYSAAYAAAESWTKYLENGGTVTAWRTQTINSTVSAVTPGAVRAESSWWQRHIAVTAAAAAALPGLALTLVAILTPAASWPDHDGAVNWAGVLVMLMLFVCPPGLMTWFVVVAFRIWSESKPTSQLGRHTDIGARR